MTAVQTGFTKSDAIRSAWGFLIPFVVVFVAGLVGILNELVTSCKTECDLSTATSAAVALAIGVGSSLLIALKNFILADGSKLKG
jgi:hypothetical protein